MAKIEKKPDHGEPMVRVISKRPGDIVLKSGERLLYDGCVLVTEQEAQELDELVGKDLIKRVN